MVFAGLDTFATVTLNDVVLGRTENQHRTYRFDVGAALHAGSNRLEVAFAPPEVVAQQRRADHGDLPNAYDQPYNQVRKMAANFGWDWGPRLLTAGIWRAVHLERWQEARLDVVRAYATVATAVPHPGERGEVTVDVELAVAPGAVDRSLLVDLQVHDPDGSLVAHEEVTLAGRSSRATVTAAVDDVRRWCPIGYGEQPLYDVIVSLECDDVVVDRTTRRVGFRDLVLDTTPDGDGAAFAFVVNGRRTWIRGFNWIPDDCFPARVTAQRLADRIDAAVAANANLLRVWGGGVYESDAFYDECDRRGVLVWQDFAFACAAYPEELLADEVRAEAIDNVDRLVAHPSLLVWCANNENLWGFADWGWPEQLAGRPWGEGFYRSLLPEVLADRDPGRPYVDGTPTSLDPAVHPNDASRGTVHLWDVWNTEDFGHYRTHAPAFRRRVRIPGAGDAPDARASARRPAARPRRSGAGTPPESSRWARQARSVVGRALRRRHRRRRLALPHAAQPGRRPDPGCGALPKPPRPVLRRDLVAAQRLLAGRELVGRGRRRTPQAVVVRGTARLRRPHDRPHARARGGAADARERTRRRGGTTSCTSSLSTPTVRSSESIAMRRTSIRTTPSSIALPASLLPGGASDVTMVVVTIGDHRAVHEAGPSSPVRPRWDVTVAATASGIDVDVTRGRSCATCVASPNGSIRTP